MTKRPLVLDGARLAAARRPALAGRADRVAERRGRPPGVLLVTTEIRPGFAPHVEKKRRECAQANIAIRTLLAPSTSTTSAVHEALAQGVEDPDVDAVFLQFPLAPAIDGDAAASVIPASKDIDLVNPLNFDRFVKDPAVAAPLTPRALIALFEHYRIATEGVQAVIVGQPDPLTRAFRIVLERSGARGHGPLAPDDPDLRDVLADADIVVVATARAGSIPSDRLRAGATAVDAGYFNPGGRGDIDPAPGIGHLAAIVPVPGGIGPMTISILLEAVIERAEQM